jgi:hypothetical protein
LASNRKQILQRLTQQEPIDSMAADRLSCHGCVISKLKTKRSDTFAVN